MDTILNRRRLFRLTAGATAAAAAVTPSAIVAAGPPPLVDESAHDVPILWCADHWTANTAAEGSPRWRLSDWPPGGGRTVETRLTLDSEFVQLRADGSWLVLLEDRTDPHPFRHRGRRIVGDAETTVAAYLAARRLALLDLAAGGGAVVLVPGRSEAWRDAQLAAATVDLRVRRAA